jgi:hypothetical protein
MQMSFSERPGSLVRQFQVVGHRRHQNLQQPRDLLGHGAAQETTMITRESPLELELVRLVPDMSLPFFSRHFQNAKLP